jgi:adenosine deaminase
MGDDSTVERDLTRLPKAHLHLHLTGSMRPATLRDLTRGADLDQHGDGSGEWRDFQRRYDAARSAMRTVADVHRVILEAAEDDVRDGSVWLELQASPTGVAHQLGMRIEAAIEAILDGCVDAARRTGLGIGLVVAANWTRPPAEAEAIAAAAARYAGDGVVGFGVSNDERGTDPADFARALGRARDAGLSTCPHSGFYTGPDHIRGCVNHGADRIGHGVTAATDPALLAELAERGVTLEVCPTSYPPLRVAESLAAVPLRTLVAGGVPVALGADDPLLFGSGLADQFRIAREILGFSDEELADLARASIRACAAPDRAYRLSQIDAWLTEPSG